MSSISIPAGYRSPTCFERIGRFWTTLIASIAGVALSAVPDVLNSYLNYVSMLGNFFSPIAGVLVFDYLLLKRTRLDVPSLFRPDGRYRYWGGFNLVAVAWTALGFLFYCSRADELDPGAHDAPVHRNWL